MADVTVADLREYLKQVGVATTDTTALQHVIDRAYDIVSLNLNFSFGAYPGSASDKVVYGQGGEQMTLPPHQQGSVTTVKDQLGVTITGWTEDADGSLYIPNPYPFWWKYNYPSRPNSGWGWWAEQRYTVTAKWGYGPAPDAIKEIELEIAANIWREKDKGAFTDVIGVESGGKVAVGYQRALTNRQQMVIDLTKRKYAPIINYF